MSVVNHRYRHVFIHVPKCAGTSMESMPFVGGNWFTPANKLVPIQPDYFSWGFVRNPYDRLLAVYCGATQHATRWPEIEAAGSFSGFLDLLPDIWEKHPHAKPMTHFLCDRQHQEIMVDFVGRYEQLEHDWNLVCQTIGLSSVTLPRYSHTKHLSWHEVYTDEMLETVNKLYSTDFAVFNYLKE